MANNLTCRSLVLQMMNGQTLNKKSFRFFKNTKRVFKIIRQGQ